MTGALRRLRALPLRSRLALLVATAVAIAVAAVAAGCWFATKAQLESQMDSSLRNVSVSDEYMQKLFIACTRPDRATAPPIGGYTVQLVTASGSTCTSAGASPIGVTAADIAVAAGVRDDTLHTANTKSGKKMRVHTYAYETHTPAPGLVPGTFAVSVARPMSEIDDPLSTLAWVLLAVHAASAPSARARPVSGWPVPGCAPSTSSPRPSSTSPAPRTSPSGSRSTARTRSPGCPVPSTR